MTNITWERWKEILEELDHTEKGSPNYEKLIARKKIVYKNLFFRIRGYPLGYGEISKDIEESELYEQQLRNAIDPNHAEDYLE